MENKIRYYSLLIGFLGFLGLHPLYGNDTLGKYKITSPDKSITMELSQDVNGQFIYSFKGKNRQLIDPSPLGFKLENGNVIPYAGWRVETASRREVRDVWKPIWGKRAKVDDHFNELVLRIRNQASNLLQNIQIVARVYNDGIAFRYEVPSTEIKTVGVISELTAYHFTDNFTAWYYNGENHNIGPELLSESDGRRLPPMTVKADGQNYLAIHEAYLIEGEPLVLNAEKGERVFTLSSKPAKLYPGYKSAWRVILYGTTPGALTDSHTIELLNPTPLPEYDFSWVKPGLALWDWRMNGAKVEGFSYEMSYPSWVRAVDFAAAQGLRYLVLDANWYGPEFHSDSDPVSGDKVNDVRKLIQYGKEKGVGIWLYLNDIGGKKFPIEKTLKQYGEWGAAGVKYGFMRGNHEEKNRWTQTVTRLCAENHLLVDYHDDPVHPYGQMRTWPNAVTRELCHAQLDGHHVFVPKTFVTAVFVNMVAGPLDMNNGMFDLRQGHTTRTDCNLPVPSTLTAEAARTLITFSGATILPDIPEFYRKYPPLFRFISEQKMPWVESKTLAGEIGEYIVMMRQTKDAFLVGAATNESGRKLSIPLTFLGSGKYEVEIIQDGVDAHYLTNRETYSLNKKTVSMKETLHVSLAPGGGVCMTFKPIKK
ncbi:glycoside hydrolase family 97 protein [Pedobacter nyackensis]|uniref:Alpha-glucosidase n=1 Tax=Pedobacter nyackensis TaxID=475255 RepID=A0A1W2D3K5_9SPHI|nr:glycoside hydrolase family 97 protein [Pedobacter nyackensis]SMC91979.1 alpha-glucosidase [Pedobacter nyackensis]